MLFQNKMYTTLIKLLIILLWDKFMEKFFARYKIQFYQLELNFLYTIAKHENICNIKQVWNLFRTILLNHNAIKKKILKICDD